MFLPKKVEAMIEQKGIPLTQIHGLGGFIGGVGLFLLIFILWLGVLYIPLGLTNVFGDWVIVLVIPAAIIYRLMFAHLAYYVAKGKRLTPGFWGVGTFFIGLLFILLCAIKPQIKESGTL